MKNRFPSFVAVMMFATAVHADSIEFNRDIRPILSNTCFQCHGPDKHSRKGDLRLDQKAELFRQRDGYKVVVPGNPAKSELFHMLTSDDPTERMPPKKSGKSLTPKQIALFKQWIEEGASWQDHWAFITPTQPKLPSVKKKSWPKNDIDRFILARLEAEGLSPSPQATREALIRRVTFDLTGLPPTLNEIDDFLADKSPRAFEKVVDRLLDSSHYGEHMTRYWLDAARYADTNGYQYDRERAQWAWRDWLIHAYNTNKPFDEFTTEQLAGDLLPNATPSQILATAFNRNHPITIEGGVVDEEYRTEYVVDRVVTTATVWMSMTFTCGRCHDHKYDPISQKEFYQFFAFFNQVPERGLNGFNPKFKAPLVLQNTDTKQIEKQITQLQRKYDSQIRSLTAAQARWEKTALQKVKTQWQIIKPSSVKSRGGATMRVLPDHSVLAGGKNPAKEIYDVTLQTNLKGIRAIRLEAMTHPSLPFKSASRGSNGNWVLSEFTMTADGKPANFASAIADYSQKNYEIAKSIDGNVGTGWAVDGNRFRVNRTAVFVTAAPVGNSSGSELKLTMNYNYGGGHQIGRFRLSVSSDAGATMTSDIENILATASARRSAQQKQKLKDHYVAQHAPPAVRQTLTQLNRLRQQRAQTAKGGPDTMIMSERPGMRTTHILERGEYDKKRDKVETGVPAVFPPMPKGAPANRLGLAQWLTHPSHPLTARVAVNRYWQRFFGTGIVKTTEDFGIQSEWPSHMELLDWLAVRFIKSGWDVKAMQKLIVMSAAYQQTSRVTPSLYDRDPNNRLIARGPRVRLDGEVIRDTALAVSGLLDTHIGGPSVYPYHPKGLWLELNNRPGYSKTYPHQTSAPHLYRRSMYTFWKRTVPPPTMATFDAPDREFCVVKRSATNTPLQALVLMHDPQFVEAARQLAGRMMTEGGRTFDERIAFGVRLAIGRMPDAGEIAVFKRIYTRRLTQYRSDSVQVMKLLGIGQSKRDEQLDTAEHAAWTTIARMILNLSETITKG